MTERWLCARLDWVQRGAFSMPWLYAMGMSDQVTHEECV